MISKILTAVLITIGTTMVIFISSIMIYLEYQENIQEAQLTGANVLWNEIIKEGIQCNTIPFEYQNQTYNLIVYECLNLTKSDGGKT